MTGPGSDDDSVVESILRLKRQLTDLKLDALVMESGNGRPAASIHDIDAIVAEVIESVEDWRRVRSPMPDDQADRSQTTTAADSPWTPSARP